MFQQTVPHHNTGGFTSHRVRLPDKEYGQALDCLVKGCSDMLLLSPDGLKLLLGKRNVQPQPDWWFAGGRIFPGETPSQSCQRLIRREFGLEIDPARFQVVCCQSLAWGMREQPPASNGTTDLQIVLSLVLTQSEVEKVVLDPKEYADSQVHALSAERLPAISNGYPPSLSPLQQCPHLNDALALFVVGGAISGPRRFVSPSAEVRSRVVAG